GAGLAGITSRDVTAAASMSSKPTMSPYRLWHYHKIKVLKRRGYGFTNRKRLFQRVYLDLHGYALFG
ncbi:hypothetical protein, partial [Thiorhodococcus mannitoliphagus]|uniref:hypothetical protein n=1 Tax=Thiorhodococcus mannitoliphagus TaxID=329406 RepID=UPI0019807EE9